ncbi:HIT family protein [Nocardia rhamnosiphila]|uniref:HIT family protein n=1 Tax=Nocardia rhamnosiphila TaxID=426716 RepID=A0ABV2WV51_9NOCA|nr:HIT family protein [Nocardia rhamnosiphila]
MSDCVFCGIVAGTAPAHRVYEDDTVTAFLDIRPITRGHTLVIPKRHATDLSELDAETGVDLFRVGHRLARAVQGPGFAADGANLLINDGKAAFQTVAHVHLHVIPRSHGDKFRFATGLVLRRAHEPDRVAATLRADLAALDGRPGADGEPA